VIDLLDRIAMMDLKMSIYNLYKICYTYLLWQKLVIDSHFCPALNRFGG